MRSAIDFCHVALIEGFVKSMKPHKVLELGIGTARLSKAILAALDYNQIGRLICVDNFKDWKSVEPDHIKELRLHPSVEIVVSSEEDYVFSGVGGFDLIVSDADHRNSAKWASQIFEIASPAGVIFFHDTNDPKLFPDLYKMKQNLNSGFCHEFRTSSRPDERCERGLLMCIKQKGLKLL